MSLRDNNKPTRFKRVGPFTPMNERNLLGPLLDSIPTASSPEGPVNAPYSLEEVDTICEALNRSERP